MLTRSRGGALARPGVIVLAGLLLMCFPVVSAVPQATAPKAAAPAPARAPAGDAEAAAQKSALQMLEDAFTSIADEVEPSVVGITSETTVSSASAEGFDWFFNWPFGFPNPNQPRGEAPRQRRTASGSGIIYTSDGYILTNDHVVGGADRVTVKLQDGREFRSTKVLRDEMGDLALVKIEATGLPAARLGDSSKVKVGHWAIAIGNPYGVGQTLTVGVISGLGRELAVPGGRGQPARFYPETLQTDAPINPGNSGGPLVNINGEVIGINTAIESPTGGNVGIGFAIPADTAKWAAEQLRKNGKVVRGFIGVNPEDVPPSMAETLGVKQGALITEVTPDSPAEKAGIQVQDVVIKFNNKPITTQLELRRAVAMTAPDTKVAVVVVRDKKQQTLTITVGERTQEALSPAPSAKTKLGIQVETLTKDKAQDLGLETTVKGVVVTEVESDSAAYVAGIRKDDVIIKVNNMATPSVSAFNSATKGLKPGDMVSTVIRRGNRTMMLWFNVD